MHSSIWSSVICTTVTFLSKQFARCVTLLHAPYSFSHETATSITEGFGSFLPLMGHPDTGNPNEGFLLVAFHESLPTGLSGE